MMIEIKEGVFVDSEHIEGLKYNNGMTEVYTHHYIYETGMPLESLKALIELTNKEKPEVKSQYVSV